MNEVIFEGIIKVLFVLLIISAAMIITRRNVNSLLMTYAVQSFIIASIAFVLYLKEGGYVLLSLMLLTLATKTFLIPFIMKRIFKSIKVGRDVEFRYLSPVSSIFVSILIIMVVYASFSKVFAGLALPSVFFLGIVLGVSLLFMGLLVMFSRVKAITKIIGYLSMENGVLLFSLFFAELPFIIEVLIVLDLLMIIVLSTILAFGISSTMKEFYEKLGFFKVFGEDEK